MGLRPIGDGHPPVAETAHPADPPALVAMQQRGTPGHQCQDDREDEQAGLPLVGPEGTQGDPTLGHRATRLGGFAHQVLVGVDGIGAVEPEAPQAALDARAVSARISIDPRAPGLEERGIEQPGLAGLEVFQNLPLRVEAAACLVQRFLAVLGGPDGVASGVQRFGGELGIGAGQGLPDPRHQDLAGVVRRRFDANREHTIQQGPVRDGSGRVGEGLHHGVEEEALARAGAAVERDAEGRAGLLVGREVGQEGRLAGSTEFVRAPVDVRGEKGGADDPVGRLATRRRQGKRMRVGGNGRIVGRDRCFTWVHRGLLDGLGERGDEAEKPSLRLKGLIPA